MLKNPEKVCMLIQISMPQNLYLCKMCKDLNGNFTEESLAKHNARFEAFVLAANKAFGLLPKEFADLYLAAPASSRFHQNYAGGLLEHCTAMGIWLYSRTIECGGSVDLTVDECARIALFHDLCKVGLYSLGKDGVYHSDPEMYKHHALLSVQKCEEFGIFLSQKERVSILLHMAGAWWNPEDETALTVSDREWISNNFGILAAVQWADMKAC